MGPFSPHGLSSPALQHKLMSHDGSQGPRERACQWARPLRRWLGRHKPSLPPHSAGQRQGMERETPRGEKPGGVATLVTHTAVGPGFERRPIAHYHGNLCQVRLEPSELSVFGTESKPPPSQLRPFSSIPRTVPHWEVHRHNLFTSICLAARAFIRSLLCLSSVKLRAIVGIKLTAQTAGAHSRHCRNSKQVGGGPVPKRPVMGIIGHYQLQCCPH